MLVVSVVRGKASISFSYKSKLDFVSLKIVAFLYSTSGEIHVPSCCLQGPGELVPVPLCPLIFLPKPASVGFFQVFHVSTFSLAPWSSCSLGCPTFLGSSDPIFWSQCKCPFLRQPLTKLGQLLCCSLNMKYPLQGQVLNAWSLAGGAILGGSGNSRM
jgi:hypothetical protein